MPAIIFALIIFIQSSIANLKTPNLGFSWQDKLLHATAYFVLGYLLSRAFYYSSHAMLKRNAILISIILGILYGASDEIHQYFIPGRSSEVADLAADAIGIILSQIFFLWSTKFATSNRSLADSAKR